jgi:hypothetical protein
MEIYAKNLALLLIVTLIHATKQMEQKYVSHITTERIAPSFAKLCWGQTIHAIKTDQRYVKKITLETVARFL